MLSIGFGGYVSSVYVHSAYMCNLFAVTLFHRCVVNWILGGVDVSSVYVHSAICGVQRGIVWCNLSISF